jgi:hypothetical protein
VLAGVGGFTVEEAKTRVSQSEWVDWLAYRQKRGSFNLGMRIEEGFSLLAWMIQKTVGNDNVEPDTYMPHADPKYATAEEIIAMVREAQKPPRPKPKRPPKPRALDG